MTATVAGPSAGRIRHLLAETEEPLVECLVRQASITPQEVRRLLSFGAVYVDRQRVTSDVTVRPGQYIRLHIDPKRFPVLDIDWTSTVLMENDEFVVVNKPAGIPVHATVDNANENVLHQVSQSLKVPLHITQRLDVEVAGVLLLAKTKQFQREFNGLLVERKVKKRYRALVTTPSKTGRHIHYMESSKRSPKTVHTSNVPNTLECSLSIVSVQPSSRAPYFEVEIDLETGRTHQIRAQLSAIGSPIVGDVLYGSSSRFETGIALFSVSTSWGRHTFTARPSWIKDCARS